ATAPAPSRSSSPPASARGRTLFGPRASRPHAGGTPAVQKPPLAVYIHWPFCRSKCPYCDFNSHVREQIDAARWTRALVADLDRQAEMAPDREVVSIFFGGGTPSLMPLDTAAALIDLGKWLWSVASD